MKKDMRELYETLNQKEVFIFDFDGTVANTEKYSWEAFNYVLSKYNKKLNEEDIECLIGETNKVIYKKIKQMKKIKIDKKYFDYERDRVFYNLTDKDNLKPNDYFLNIIKKFPNKKIVILTSNNEYVIRNWFKKWDLEDVVSRIISVSDHGFSKQFVLENTKQFFNKEKNKIVLFEDVNKNLKLGKDNNIYTVGIEHEYNKGRLIDADCLI